MLVRKEKFPYQLIRGDYFVSAISNSIFHVVLHLYGPTADRDRCNSEVGLLSTR